MCDYPPFPEPAKLNPKDPDYTSFSVSGGGAIGFTIILTRDRYKNLYLGGGVNVGKSLTVLSGSYVNGWIGDPFDASYPSEDNTMSFLEGFAINGSAGFLGGAGVTFSPYSNISNWSYETGIYSPQVGLTFSGTGLLSDY